MNFEAAASPSQERENLNRAIDALEEQRAILGDQIVDIAQASIREKLAQLEAGSRAKPAPQERKLITVLFADVSGFTAMAEAMDHEIVSSVINSLWSRVDKAIAAHGGRIDKHIGDAVMALFGTPVAREDDPERAIRAALQIQAEVQKWKQEFDISPSHGPSQSQNIQLRIGINTGRALLGTVGTIGEYTAIGDTVNLANRLEQAAPIGGILISHDTYQHVRGVFEVTVLDPITVKGKSELIQVYVINDARPRSFRVTTRGVEGIETRTIGREEELAKMKLAFEGTIEERRMHLLNIVAEAGTGKSRLLYEFTKWLDVQKHAIHLFKGRATQEMAQIPYALLRDIFAAGFGIQDHDSTTLARQKLEQGILNYLGNKEDATLYTHFIGHLIGLDFSTSPHLKGILGDARQIHDLAFHYAAQFLTDITREQVAVIFLEDIHWADRGSLDFFDHLMNTRPDLPLLIVGLTRSTLFEERPDWGTGPIQMLRLDLLPLSEASCRRLVQEILQKVPVIPSTLTDLVVAKAEGSPFYVEELIKVLIDKGMIIRGEPHWRVEMERFADLNVPDTLTGLLQARLDSLSLPAKETLQQASVVGRIFWTNVVEHMQNPETRDADMPTPLIDRLGMLRAKELIFQYGDLASAKTPEYIFKNAILHSVTYESVLLRLRPIYHLQAAEGLIRIGGERVSEYAGRVGEHYEQAGDLLKAADWYARAGRQAQDTYEPGSAVGYYQKALKFLNEKAGSDQITEQLEIYSWLGEVLIWQARYADAANAYHAMLNLASDHHDLIAQSRALQGIASSLGYQGDHRAALENAIRAEAFARQADARTEIAKSLWAQGSARYRLGESRTALSLGKQALEIASELNNPNEMGRSLNLLGAAHYVLGQYAQAQNYWEDALKLFQELGNRQQGMLLLSNLGVIADARGDYETAFQRYHAALEIAREIGNRDGEILFLTNRGGEQVALKNYAAAEVDLRKAIELAGIEGSWCLPNTYYYHAEALIGLGKYEPAFYSAYQALALGREDKVPENIGAAWRALGKVSGMTGKPISLRLTAFGERIDFSAEDCFRKSAEIFAEAEIEGERARTLRDWAGYELGLGHRDQATRMWQEAREIFVKLGAEPEVQRMDNSPV
ncbi:MAG TPA: adenylate/guanylate cyclase domain-containing protein [Anaerolineales bacterium]|nr:adenylate/guanylate cyclase domain-containing protein [Anaerolineales bacterium]